MEKVVRKIGLAFKRSEASRKSQDSADLSLGDFLNIGSNVTFRPMAIDSIYQGMNDAPLVVKMTDGTVDFLFMGDATEAVEDKMDNTFGSAMDVEILKVGHHGSRWSTSSVFLSETTPAVAVIEVGADNNYGHPTNETLDRLGAMGVLVYRTDLNGSMAITTDGTTWSISTNK
jgi:beta-lactamase superfamily II metal-dependent hydrolase